jgi:hypothetical protein
LFHFNSNEVSELTVSGSRIDGDHISFWEDIFDIGEPTIAIFIFLHGKRNVRYLGVL